MVEANGNAPKTQLPATKSNEETKSEQVYMYGSAADVLADTMSRLEGVEMNALEEGLLTRFLADPAQNWQQVEGVLRKLEQKNQGEVWTMKKLRRTIPLFMRHDFWGTQPVPNYFDKLPLSKYNAPLETKTVAEVQQTGYPLPAGFEWCTVNLGNDQEANEVYDLLTNHYVEDTEGKFRFDYSVDFLRWAL